ncbi:uncharacterized protein N7459_001503 [Penicillium hispanicum]|uniref:uncharacterized protein n=1 Tax=Penicillium hispanicum TaxID=1080232 RepID=UPI0025407AC1|nr:uncharacterized protein N7459_001503 [Penicillium hispanicum]KAJ5595295.1 hypothetical protein N7459_001503 [Penicillium hispanicum]
MAIDSNGPGLQETNNPATGTQDTSNESENEEPQYKPQGSICGVHNLYQTKPDESGNTSWTKDYPESLVAPAEDAESAQYALIVRNAKCYDGRRSLEMHSIVIQSEPLRQFIGKVLAGYPGITPTLERLEFTSPFRPFVHRWENFLQAREEETDATTKEHAELLYKILEEELQDTLARKNDLVRNGVITYPLIWTIFEPGDVVVSAVGGRTRGYTFRSATIDCRTKQWNLGVKYIDYDGTDFGFRDTQFRVPPFIGTEAITSLPAFPLKFHADKEAVRETLVAQGRHWENHKGYRYKQYEGIAIGFREDYEVKYHVKSRIIIDTDAFNTFHPSETVRVYGEDDIPDELDDDLQMITSSMVYGYSLKDREWLQFSLDCSKEIVWDSQAFDSLVLPEEQKNLKDLILAFAKAQSKQVDGFDDVVQGKGRGIIMQLAGPPGVGKTLTAESVAEVMHVPLYAMSAGDLGTDAEKVEDSLKEILRMIPKWGAVLLLDEADVFMETRTSTDLHRNELVSIFLRMLEYYEGILFLTTNRAEHIDPAFESRIHVSLTYKNLDFASRRHVWLQFIGRSTSAEPFTDAQLDNLASVELNGRQIKNLLKTASLLAWSQEATLRFEHVETVLSLRQSNK